MQKFLDGGDLEDDEVVEKPKKEGFFGKLAKKLKSKPKNTQEEEVELEFDKDSDEWVFEGGALTCEICNESMPDGQKHKCSEDKERSSSEQFIFTCEKCDEDISGQEAFKIHKSEHREQERKHILEVLERGRLQRLRENKYLMADEMRRIQ